MTEFTPNAIDKIVQGVKADTGVEIDPELVHFVQHLQSEVALEVAIKRKKTFWFPKLMSLRYSEYKADFHVISYRLFVKNNRNSLAARRELKILSKAFCQYRESQPKKKNPYANRPKKHDPVISVCNRFVVK